MQSLLAQVFRPALANPWLDTHHDSAVLDVGQTRVALTTDAYVVQPLQFPGGDMGAMAVYGTVNDLAMAGARPLYLTASFILEEGFPIATLTTLVQSMAAAAQRAGVAIVTGDTKVVERGKGDGLFITTAGLGIVASPAPIAPQQVQPGDGVIVSGDIGRHGMAILAAREGLDFEGALTSDLAPVADLVLDLLAAGRPIHCLRDLTRGGLATALHEIATTAALTIQLEETAIPVGEPVQGACEILGLDPLYVACEGRFVAFVPRLAVAEVLAQMQDHPLGEGAALIGEVRPAGDFPLTLVTQVGTVRVLDLLSGEQLPRIC